MTASVQANLLDASGVSIAQVNDTLGLLCAHDVNFADLYFQSSQHETWVLEDGIIKNGSYNIERGVGVRAISGEKTGFAYSDDINIAALHDAAKAARTIAPAVNVTKKITPFASLAADAKYMSDNPLLQMEDAEKIALLKATDKYIREQASNASQVSVSMTGVYEEILVAATDGTLATDRRFGTPLVVGFVYSLFLRIPLVLPFMVWFSVVATIAIVFGGAYYAGELATEWKNADPPMYTDDNIKIARYGSYALYAFGGLLAIVFLFMRKRIQLAMGCVKEASKAILRLPLIILFPVIQALGFAAFMIVWTVYSAYIASMGEFKTEQIDTVPGLFISVRYFVFSDFIKQSGWFMLFCFFWSGQFIISIGEIIFAMSISKWYFARDKKKVGSGAVISSITTSIWYHTGTAAFGSLIIAIIQMIRSAIAYLQKKADEMDSSLAKAILCCLQCVVLCFEKIFKFINKNAYIQTAIFGTSFCTSAKEAYCLIMRNAARIIAITYVSGGVVFVGKMFITTLTTGAAYFVLDHELRDELYSNIGPLFFIALSAWFISGMFMGVFDMGIATILQCFVADEEMYGDSQSMYAEGSLKNWVEDHGKSSEKRGCME